jgi:hypothetical protein
MTPERRNSGARVEVHSLLANGSPNTRCRNNEQKRKSIASQRSGKHVSVTKGHFPWLLVAYTRAEKTDSGGRSRVKAGSNISTVALRVVGGAEEESLESETVKYDQESHGTRTRKSLRWREPAEILNDRPLLSSQRAPHINKLATVCQ